MKKTISILMTMVLASGIAFAIGPSSKLQEKEAREQMFKHIGDYALEDGGYTVLRKIEPSRKYTTIHSTSIVDVDAFVDENSNMLTYEKKCSLPNYMKKLTKSDVLDSETCLYEFEFNDYSTDLNVYYLNEKNKVVAYYYRFQTDEQRRAEATHTAIVISAWATFAQRLGADIGAIGDVYMRAGGAR